MKRTLHAEDVRRFRRWVSTLIVRPKNTMVQFVAERGKLAMMISGYNWTFVMPVRGRRPTKPFKIPLLPLWNTCERADDNLTVNIDTKKGRGEVEWLESQNWRGSHSFTFGLYNYTVKPVPQIPNEMKILPADWLSPLAKCNKICAKCSYPSLASVRITPGGEFGCTDGKQMLLEQTTARLPWAENILVHATDLYRVRMQEFRDRDSFQLGVDEGQVCFDFGDCRFFTKPDADHYPKDLHRILPKEEDVRTRLSIDPKDAAFLKKHLDDLPGRKDHDSPVILLCDYDRTVSVHGTTGDPEKTKAVLLVRSTYQGDTYVVQTNRKHLRQALSLGCLDFQFGSSYPLAFADNIRYCWMPVEGNASALPLESERPMTPRILLRSDQSPTKDQS